MNIEQRKDAIKRNSDLIKELEQENKELADISHCNDEAITFKVGDIVSPMAMTGVRCYTYSDRELVIDSIVLDSYYGVNYICTVLKADKTRSKLSSSFSFY